MRGHQAIADPDGPQSRRVEALGEQSLLARCVNSTHLAYYSVVLLKCSPVLETDTAVYGAFVPLPALVMEIN